MASPGPVNRPIKNRMEKCAVCPSEISVWSLTSPTDGAPEMLNFAPNAWTGFVRDDAPPHAWVFIFCCSHKCTQLLLAE